MTELPEPKPRRPTAQISDLIVEVAVKCECGRLNVRHVPIQVEPVQKFERDELGNFVKDEEGNPKPKIRISYEYDHLPRVSSNYDQAREEEYRALYQRAEEQKILAFKVKKKREPVELTA